MPMADRGAARPRAGTHDPSGRPRFEERAARPGGGCTVAGRRGVSKIGFFRHLILGRGWRWREAAQQGRERAAGTGRACTSTMTVKRSGRSFSGRNAGSTQGLSKPTTRRGGFLTMRFRQTRTTAACRDGGHRAGPGQEHEAHALDRRPMARATKARSLGVLPARPSLARQDLSV